MGMDWGQYYDMVKPEDILQLSLVAVQASLDRHPASNTIPIITF